jgi:hypothetical protein
MHRTKAQIRPTELRGHLDLHPHHIQDNDWGCGPCALSTAAASLGIWVDPKIVAAGTRSETFEGTSTGILMAAARRLGCKAFGRQGVGIKRLRKWVMSPDHAVIGYQKSRDHWVVLPWVHPTEEIVAVLDSLTEQAYPTPWDRDLGFYALVLRRA